MGYTLNRDPKSKKWHVFFVDRSGRRVRKSSKQSDKRKAVAFADDLYRRFADPSYQAAHEATVSDACNRVLREVAQAGKSKGTLHFYKTKLSQIARVLGADRRMATIEAPVIDALIETRTTEGAKANTISKELVALMRVLKSAHRRGEYHKDPRSVMPVKFSSGYTPKTRALTIDQAWSLIAELPPTVARYVAFTFATSARDAAAGRAMVGDIEADRIQVRDKKTAKAWRKVPIISLTKPFADRALEGAPKSGALLSGLGSVRHALARACKRMGIPSVSSNDLRRSVAKWMRDASVPPDVIASFFGHSTSRMIEWIYGPLDVADSLGPVLQGHLDKTWNKLGSKAPNRRTKRITRTARRSRFLRQIRLNSVVPRDRIELPTRGFSIQVSSPSIGFEKRCDGSVAWNILDETWIDLPAKRKKATA